MSSHLTEALRAAAEITYWTIVLGTGALGEYVSGPIGAGLGAASATPLALVLKALITNRIKDPRVRDAAGPALTAEMFVREALVNGVSTAAGAYIAKGLAPVVRPLKRVFGFERVLGRLGKLGRPCEAVLDGWMQGTYRAAVAKFVRGVLTVRDKKDL